MTAIGKLLGLNVCKRIFFLKSPELNPIKIGCIKTPKRLSYFCEDHSGCKIKFFYQQNYVGFYENQIKKENINRIYEKMIKIWDFYINQEDEILYLCEFDGNKAHWIIEDEIKISYIKEFYELKKEVEKKMKMNTQSPPEANNLSLN